MRLEPFLDPERVIVIDRSAAAGLDRSGVLHRLAEVFSRAGNEEGIGVPHDELVRGFETREANRTTAMPEGVAFPHALMPGIRTTMLAAALVRGGVDFSGVSVTGKAGFFGGSKPARGTRCDLIFAMVGPDSAPVDHVRVLARLARLVHPPEVRERLRGSADALTLHAELIREDRSHVC